MFGNTRNNYASFRFSIAKINASHIIGAGVLWLLICLPAYAEEHEEYEMINISAGQADILDNLVGP